VTDNQITQVERWQRQFRQGDKLLDILSPDRLPPAYSVLAQRRRHEFEERANVIAALSRNHGS
jgi:hypothetical protein